MVQYIHQVVAAECPVCGNDDAENLYSVSAQQAAQHFVRRQADEDAYWLLVERIQGLWRSDTCAVNRCRKCRFCFSHPYVAGDFDFYRIAHPRHGYPKWKWENQVTLDAIRTSTAQRPSADLRLLEIGAGNGAFIRRVGELVPVKNIVCTEYSEYGIDQIRALGAECHNGDVRALDTKYNGEFNFVCMFQVLEHLDGINSLFRKINEITADSAELFVAVPNDRFIEFIETHDALLDMPPNHIGRWNLTAFSELAERQGWRVVEHKYEPGEQLLSMANRFCVYRYLNESQKSGTLANYIDRIKNRYVRYGLLQIAAKFYGLTSPRGLLESVSKEYGMAQWVCLRKNQPSD